MRVQKRLFDWKISRNTHGAVLSFVSVIVFYVCSIKTLSLSFADIFAPSSGQNSDEHVERDDGGHRAARICRDTEGGTAGAGDDTADGTCPLPVRPTRLDKLPAISSVGASGSSQGLGGSVAVSEERLVLREATLARQRAQRERDRLQGELDRAAQRIRRLQRSLESGGENPYGDQYADCSESTCSAVANSCSGYTGNRDCYSIYRSSCYQRLASDQETTLAGCWRVRASREIARLTQEREDTRDQLTTADDRLLQFQVEEREARADQTRAQQQAKPVGRLGAGGSLTVRHEASPVDYINAIGGIGLGVAQAYLNYDLRQQQIGLVRDAQQNYTLDYGLYCFNQGNLGYDCLPPNPAGGQLAYQIGQAANPFSPSFLGAGWQNFNPGAGVPGLGQGVLMDPRLAALYNTGSGGPMNIWGNYNLQNPLNPNYLQGNLGNTNNNLYPAFSMGSQDLAMRLQAGVPWQNTASFPTFNPGGYGVIPGTQLPSGYNASIPGGPFGQAWQGGPTSYPMASFSISSPFLGILGQGYGNSVVGLTQSVQQKQALATAYLQAGRTQDYQVTLGSLQTDLRTLQQLQGTMVNYSGAGYNGGPGVPGYAGYVTNPVAGSVSVGVPGYTNNNLNLQNVGLQGIGGGQQQLYPAMNTPTGAPPPYAYL